MDRVHSSIRQLEQDAQDRFARTHNAGNVSELGVARRLWEVVGYNLSTSQYFVKTAGSNDTPTGVSEDDVMELIQQGDKVFW